LSFSGSQRAAERLTCSRSNHSTSCAREKISSSPCDQPEAREDSSPSRPAGSHRRGTAARSPAPCRFESRWPSLPRIIGTMREMRAAPHRARGTG
jgi:hypothetical protein